MSKDSFLKISRTRQNHSIKGQVRAVDFEQDGHYIIYIPSLGLSAYGDDVVQARKMMSEFVIPDFCETLLQQSLSKIINELKNLGWAPSPFFKSELSTAAHIDKEGILKDFDLPRNTVMHESLLAV